MTNKSTENFFDGIPEVDLHTFWQGVTRNEVNDFIIESVRDLKFKGERYARYIIGKGIGSRNGPIIPELTIDCFEMLVQEKTIKSYSYEKNEGTGLINEGAVIVKLF